MNIITITKENIEKEHICCAISNTNDCQVESKKTWMKERFVDGLVFKKCDVRGKCFIEYIPAEYAWSPITASEFMFINCLWVSGQHKGKGYSNLLIDACIQDSKEKGKKGLVILSSKKKMPFLSDPSYLKYKGFVTVDQADPYFELMMLPFGDSFVKPKFKDCVGKQIKEDDGFVLYYTNQCPFTVKYVPIIEEVAKNKKIMFKSIRIENMEQAQNTSSPFTTYSLFYNGKFVTNEILSIKRFEKIILELI